MADAVVIQEFLATLGYNVDEASQRRFVDSLESIGKTIAGLGLGLTGLAGTIMGVVSSMAGSASQMGFISQNLGETVTNIERAIYMWQRLGVAPAETMKAMQSIQQMRLHDPARFQLFSTDRFGGEGTPEQQLEHYLERFRQAGPQMQFQMRQTFEGLIPEQLLLTAATRGGQAAAGGQEFNFVDKLFHFNRDRYAKESNDFEQAWMSFHLRLNTWFKSNVAEPLTVLETQGLTALSNWIDRNGPELTKKLEDIGKGLFNAFKMGLDAVKDLITWFEKLPPGAQHAAEAIAVIGVALAALQTNPTILALTALGFALKKLLDDYEAWKKAGSSGPSPLGIDYAALGKNFEYILTKIDDVAKSVGGWQNALLDLALVVGGAKFLGIFIRTFAAIQTAAVATGTAIAGEIGAGISAAAFGLTTLVGATVALKGDEHLTDEQKKQRDKRTEDEARQYFREHPDWAQQHPDDARRLGVVPGQQAPAQAAPTPGQPGQPGAQQGEHEGVWKSLRDFLTSGFGLLGTAHAEEIPENLKQLNTSVSDLDDTLKDWIDQHVLGGGLGGPGQEGGMFGGGGGIPGRAPGGGGGGGGPVNWKDPEVMKALSIFQGMGYSMDDAVGIVTNLWAESGVRTGAVNPTGHVGVAQWDRQRQMEFFMQNGKKVQDATLEEQLKFIDYELHHKEQAALARLQQAHGARAKAGAFGEGFERYGSDAETERRKNLASTAPSALWAQNSVNNITNAARTANVTQTNNVTVNASGGSPNDFIQAWDNQLYRQHADLQRRGQASYH